MRTHYANLTAICLDRKQHERTADYWYLVQTNNTAHVAFRSKRSLLLWLSERGLSLENDLPDPGTWARTNIVGEYYSESHMNRDTLPSNSIHDMPVMSNGEYTTGLVTEESGIRTVHYLNPNVRDRQLYDYSEQRAIRG